MIKLTNMKDFLKRLSEYSYKRAINKLYESLGPSEMENTIDEIFRKKYDNIIVKDSLKSALATQNVKVSVNNKSEMGKLYQRFINNIKNREKGDMRVSLSNINMILAAAGMKSLVGFMHQMKENKAYLSGLGFNMQNIDLDVKRGRKSEYVFDEACRSKYSHGEEIDLNYNGEGHEGYDHQIVVRSQHGETPMMLYGFNGRYSSTVCNEIRHIYSEDTNADYYYCSGISLDKWKRCDDTRKRCCDRNGELYE